MEWLTQFSSLEPSASGSYGVLVAGCRPGDCPYLCGNDKLERRVSILKKVLEQFGLEPERLRLECISASEGHGRENKKSSVRVR